MSIFIYLYTTGYISFGICRLWIIEMSETNKNNDIKCSSLKTDMANSKIVETFVALASQGGNYNFPCHL
jgi:hypothetical protein